MHKRIRLTPLARKEIWQHYGTGNWTLNALAREFRVSRPTIYKVIERARKQEFTRVKRPQPLGECVIHLPVRRTNGKAERVIKNLNADVA